MSCKIKLAILFYIVFAFLLILWIFTFRFCSKKLSIIVISFSIISLITSLIIRYFSTNSRKYIDPSKIICIFEKRKIYNLKQLNLLINESNNYIKNDTNVNNDIIKSLIYIVKIVGWFITIWIIPLFSLIFTHSNFTMNDSIENDILKLIRTSFFEAFGIAAMIFVTSIMYCSVFRYFFIGTSKSRYFESCLIQYKYYLLSDTKFK